MIFLTVGTQFPFDRLVRAVDEAVQSARFDDEVFAQIGRSSYRPRCFPSVQTLGAVEFTQRMMESSAVVSHAGIGTILSALDHERPLLVMPRRKAFGEVVNDHQVATGQRFSSAGLVLLAQDEGEVVTRMTELRTFQPRLTRKESNPVADRVREFLHTLRRT